MQEAGSAAQSGGHPLQSGSGPKTVVDLVGCQAYLLVILCLQVQPQALFLTPRGRAQEMSPCLRGTMTFQVLPSGKKGSKDLTKADRLLWPGSSASMLNDRTRLEFCRDFPDPCLSKNLRCGITSNEWWGCKQAFSPLSFHQSWN